MTDIGIGYEWDDWVFEHPPGNEWELGGQYVATAKTFDGRFWAKFLVEVTSINPDDEQHYYGIDVITCLDGTPGFIDGWMKGERERP